MASVDTPVRGDETRAQLIEAGLKLFGRLGYEAVPTRMLAREAGVNLAAIAYHFGGKQGLFEAVAESVVAESRQRSMPVAEALQADLAEAGSDRAKLAAAAERMIRAQIRTFVAHGPRQEQIRLVLREFAVPSTAFPILFKNLIEPMHRAVTGLTAAVRGVPPDDPAAILAAHVMMGQIIGFGIAKQPLLRRLDWTDYTPERIEAIADVLVPMALNALGLGQDTAVAGEAAQ